MCCRPSWDGTRASAGGYSCVAQPQAGERGDRRGGATASPILECRMGHEARPCLSAPGAVLEGWRLKWGSIIMYIFFFEVRDKKHDDRRIPTHTT